VGRLDLLAEAERVVAGVPEAGRLAERKGHRVCRLRRCKLLDVRCRDRGAGDAARRGGVPQGVVTGTSRAAKANACLISFNQAGEDVIGTVADAFRRREQRRNDHRAGM
jgi:hypothetical protein